MFMIQKVNTTISAVGSIYTKHHYPRSVFANRSRSVLVCNTILEGIAWNIDESVIADANVNVVLTLTYSTRAFLH